MTRRVLGVLGVLAIGLTVATGCGSQPGVTATPTSQPAPPGPLLLAQFDRGVGAVSAASDVPVWTDPDAVAALDGSAVFSFRTAQPTTGVTGETGDDLVRIDPGTGSVIASWPRPAAMASISAVSPGGRWIALTDRQPGYAASDARTSTRLVVFDSTTGAETRRIELTGDVRPEAFSVDGKLVFVLDYRGDHYRVQTIVLATSDRYETGGRTKAVEAEVMHGTTVRGVLNADHTLLSTLYRNPGDAEEPAFVHILDLRYGWAYCADLPAPFGTGPAGSDRIELTPAGTVIVTAEPAGRIAEIHIEEVHESTDRPVTVEYRDVTAAAKEPVFDAAPGFGHVIATLG